MPKKTIQYPFTFLDENFISSVIMHEGLNSLHALLKYSFIDVHSNDVLKLAESLLSLVQDSSSVISDEKIICEIYNWIAELPEAAKIGFPLSYTEYLNQKVEAIAGMIEGSIEIALENGAILDVGASDCSLVYLVGRRLNLLPYAVDIKSELEWGQGKTNHMTNVQHVFYDGADLKSVFPKKKFAVISYNHSLHHFPSFQAQCSSLKQDVSLLDPGGVIFLSEHDNCLDDNLLAFSHLLLSLRRNIDRGNIRSSQEAVQSTIFFKKECGPINFLSGNILSWICEELGLIPVKKQARRSGDSDVSKSYFCSFLKPEQPAARRNPSKFFDDTLVDYSSLPLMDKSVPR